MPKTNEPAWKPFHITELFNPDRGTEKNMSSLEEGSTPLVSARKMNNGVKSFVNVPPTRVRTSGSITLNNDGDGGAGLAFYQPAGFALDTHVTQLKPIQEMNENSKLFIAASLSGVHEFFGHGYSISDDRIKTIQVMLPCTKEGAPNYELMNQNIKNQKEALLKKYTDYVNAQLEELGEPIEIAPLSDLRWEPFLMNDIFVIGHGFYNKKPPCGEDGTIPFIGASGINNGVTGFCTRSNIENSSKTGREPNESIDRKLFPKGCICVVNNGSAIGYTYYQSSEFTCSHDVNPLVLKERNMSKYEATGCLLHLCKKMETYKNG